MTRERAALLGLLLFVSLALIGCLRVNESPVAKFACHGDPEGFLERVKVGFDASPSYDLDGTIVRWSWDFGDGTAGSGKVVDHAFGEAGEYAVVLTVTDDRGGIGTATLSVRVLELPVPGQVKLTVTNMVPALRQDPCTCDVIKAEVAGWPGPVEIDWGDGTVSDVSEGHEAYHSYHYYVQGEAFYTIRARIRGVADGRVLDENVIYVTTCGYTQPNVVFGRYPGWTVREGTVHGIDVYGYDEDEEWTWCIDYPPPASCCSLGEWLSRKMAAVGGIGHGITLCGIKVKKADGEVAYSYDSSSAGTVRFPVSFEILFDEAGIWSIEVTLRDNDPDGPRECTLYREIDVLPRR
jgi:PKD repeat protein